MHIKLETETDHDYYRKLPVNFIKWTENDIHTLDCLLQDIYGDDPECRKKADNILCQVKVKKDAWCIITKVLEKSKYNVTKYFAVEIFGDFIKTEWNSLSPQQQLGFKQYVMSLFMEATLKGELITGNHLFLEMLVSILAAILVYEYPEKWPTFFDDFFSASKFNALRCKCGLDILNILRKKMIGPAKNISWLKAKVMRENMTNFFVHSFLLCEYIIQNRSESKLVDYALTTLLMYIDWVPKAFIFRTTLIKVLIQKLNSAPHQITIIQLLTEIVSICPKELDSLCAVSFLEFMKFHIQILSPSPIYVAACARNSPTYEILTERLCILTRFLTSLLKKHGPFLSFHNREGFDYVLCFILEMCELNVVEIVKPSMELFNTFLRYLVLNKMRKMRNKHPTVVLKLHNFIIRKITPPKKITKKNKNGKVITVYEDAASVQIFANMKLILAFLTYLNPLQTLKIIISNLSMQVHRGFSAKGLDSVCCAAVVIRSKSLKVKKGILVRCMKIKIERKLYWTIIKMLLRLGKLQKRKTYKRLIAYNLMHIIGEYADMLNTNWHILKVAVDKMFQFMHDKKDYTKDLACKTFIKIAEKCKTKLVVCQPEETMSYFEKILSHMDRLPSTLNPKQILLFYKAVAIIAVAPSPLPHNDKIIKGRILKLMAPPNAKWNLIFLEIEKPYKLVQNPLLVRDIIYLLRINKSVCKGVGYEYVHQLDVIYEQMLLLYERMNRQIYCEVRKKKYFIKNPTLISMRTVRKHILNLYITWIGFITKEQHREIFLKHSLPGLIFSDYCDCVHPSLREPEVISLLITMTNSVKSFAYEEIIKFCTMILDCTRRILRQDSKTFCETRKRILLLIHALTVNCFKALRMMFLNMFSSKPVFHFHEMLNYVIESTKEKESSVLSLKTLWLLLRQIQKAQSVFHKFYQTYYLYIFKHIIFLVVRPLGIAGLRLKACILSHMIALIAKKKYKGPIHTADQTDEENNAFYIQCCIAHIVIGEFNNLNEDEVEFVVNGFLQHYKNIPSFVEFLKNLPLISQELNDREREETPS